MKPIILLIIIAMSFSASIASAEEIYSWKDKDGNLKFSNTPPPEGITDYQIMESAPDVPDDQNPADKRRTSYDRMVEKASKEADEAIDNRKREAAIQKKKADEEQRRAKLEAERKNLEQQIQAIRNRAISPTYPPGMKQSQIEALEKKIEKLEEGSKSSEKKDQKFSNKY